MPVAKHLSYARSRSRTKQSHRIAGASFTHLHAYQDEAPRALSQPQPAIMAASVGCRSIVKTVTEFADSAGDILLAIASCILMETLAGCAAYAIAMYGIPKAMDDGESGDPKPSGPPVHSRLPSRPALLLISANTEADISVAEIRSPPVAAQPCVSSKCLARPEQTRGARSAWRTPIMSAALLLSKIRERYVRHRAIAELRNLDDRSLSDIGISRCDIGYIARHGVRPE
jgi:uncharacterized protein YjiS (DUF1127 family)